MYTKQNNPQGRRTPLSLNTGGGGGGASATAVSHNKQHHDHQQHQQSHSKGKSSSSSAAATINGSNGSNMSAKNENKNAMHHKTEPTLAELKKQHMLEKKQQQQLQQQLQLQQQIQQQLQQQQQQQYANDNNKKSVEKNDEKRTQNGNSGKSNISGKEKQTQNGTNSNNGNADVAKDKRDNKVEKLFEKQSEKTEKSDKSLKAQKDDKKEKTNDNSDKDKEMGKEKKTDAKQDKAKNENENEKMDTSNNEGNNARTITPVKAVSEKEKKNVTPQKSIEKPQKATPPSIKDKAGNVTPTANTPVVVTTINDVDMEPLKVDNSPIKFTQIEAVAVSNAIPAATSTPGKVSVGKRSTNAKTEIQLALQAGGTPDRNNCPRTFNEISGRRSIRPLSEFASNQYRESYRRINTELDVTSTTNTSLNVTVGSEVPNNSSFSFFGRGRKRDRTPPSQSTMELQNDVEVSPPKRVRLDMHGFFSAVASPLTMLRSRFSKASIQSSTPLKLNSKLTTEDEGEVQNVSGISIHEEMPTVAADADEVTATEDITVGNKSNDDKEVPKNAITPEENVLDGKNDAKCDLDKSTTSIDVADSEDINIKESPIVSDPLAAKNKRCHIM